MTNKLGDIRSAKVLLEALRKDAFENGNLSIRGVARLCGVADTSIIRDAAFKSQKLAEKLTSHGFDAAALIEEGFPPQAVILTLEYFAYESKAKAESAKALMRTFGVLGLMATLQELGTITVEQPRQLPPIRDAIEYVKAYETLESLPEGILKNLLRDRLVDEMETETNNKRLPGKKTEYTIAKVRACELGYTVQQINNGSALGRFVRQRIEPAFSERVGRFDVYHYVICDELDEAIHQFFENR